MTKLFAPYRPRHLAFLGTEPVAGCRLKVYAIWREGATFAAERFTAWRDLAGGSLPQPASAEGRPGVGFVILHQAQGDDYLILTWWDRENELPARVFINGAAGWRPAQNGESFCVWDLRVMWWEREAYVGTMLTGKEAGTDAYLSTTIEGYA